MFAGSFAGMTASLCTYPLDLMRTRMAAHWGKDALYNGYIHAFRTVIETEGASALFSGIRPTLIGIIPYAGISYAMFHTLKSKIDEEHHGLRKKLGIGMISGLTAQMCTYPIEIVRRRQQVNPTNDSMLQAMRKIIKTEVFAAVYIKHHHLIL
eukprot:UN29907